ncbi:HpcH/HpaI aldolase family protein [Streptomyces sp. CA-100214]
MGRIKAKTTLDRIAAEGRKALGPFVQTMDATTTAAMATTGIDFVIIDREHGISDLHSTLQHIRAADAASVIPLVRVLKLDPTEIQANLDIGAQGIVVPKVGSAEEARAAVLATRYLPGGRGLCSSVEGARWAAGADWAEHKTVSNDNIVLIPLIETKAGLDNLAEIIAVDGVDYVFFGLGDLAQDLGLPGGIFDPDSAPTLVKLWDEAVALCHSVGVKIGTTASFDTKGADFLTTGSDTAFVHRGLRALVTQIRDDERILQTSS